MKKRSLLAGVVIGSSIALLLAPHSGKKTRNKLKFQGEKWAEECKYVCKKTCKRSNKKIVKASNKATKQAKVFVIKAQDFLQK